MLDGSQASALEGSELDDETAERARQAERGLEAAIAAATEHLRSLQRDDGHWCAELEGDSILESEYALMLLFFGRRDDPRFDQLCAHLRSRQEAHGGWSIFPGGPPDVSPTVKAYFVLKIAGDDPQAPHMVRARETALRLGGLEACNSFTKLYLSIFGAWEWRDAPAVPPELILLPRWFYLNIYEMSSWSRAIVVPLSMLWALKPSRKVSCSIAELRTGVPVVKRGTNARERAWYGFFRVVNGGLHVAEKLGLFRPVRALALRRCEKWCLERLGSSGGLAAIVPSIANVAMALHCRGYSVDHPALSSQLEELERLEILEDGLLRLQPCFSPVWDTALALNALVEAGVPCEDPAVQRGVVWLLDHEVKQPGDWKVKSPDPEPGGWYFEYANEFYPDCDDTAEVLALLAQVRLHAPSEEQRRRAAVTRALRWQLGMQSRDGGWGAFDKDCDREVLTYVPFADHNAMIDPSTADVTARTVEALIAHGMGKESAPVRRALSFLERQQEAEGAWYGRWGANYLYGTWLALCAFKAAGLAAEAPALRGARWFLDHQNDDGGWGETLLSYEDPSLRGRGESTTAQTAWAMLGLLAVVDQAPTELHAAIGRGLRRAAELLIARQRTDGSWQDLQWTGTGFPQVFYLRYHYYDRYFPLQALATYERWLRGGLGHTNLREVSQ